MRPALPTGALQQLFGQARTYPRFCGAPVPREQLEALHELLRWGPTAFNCQPARFVFVQSAAARERLATCVSSGNRPKVLSAGVSVIVAYALDFVDELPRFTAHPQAMQLFAQMPALVEPTALRNGSLQAGYLILAARALGLDVGVLTGFDGHALKQAFFTDRPWQPNLVANLGVGDPASLGPRFPRYAFDEVATVI